jgi:hypothetical protein
MAKVVRVRMPDGSQYDVPVERIADHRATEYAREFGPPLSLEYETTFVKERALAIDDHDELLDWAANNMNWDDVEDVAVLVETAPALDYQEGWVNGEKEVVEV